MSNPVSAGRLSVARDPSGEARPEGVNDVIDTAALAVVILLLVLVAIV